MQYGNKVRIKDERKINLVFEIKTRKEHRKNYKNNMIRVRAVYIVIILKWYKCGKKSTTKRKNTDATISEAWQELRQEPTESR